MKALDWTEALKERLLQDEQNLQHLLRGCKKNNPPRQEDAHAAAMEAPAVARATTLKKGDAMTTPLIHTMAFGIGM